MIGRVPARRFSGTHKANEIQVYAHSRVRLESCSVPGLFGRTWKVAAVCGAEESPGIPGAG